MGGTLQRLYWRIDCWSRPILHSQWGTANTCSFQYLLFNRMKKSDRQSLLQRQGFKCMPRTRVSFFTKTFLYQSSRRWFLPRYVIELAVLSNTHLLICLQQLKLPCSFRPGNCLVLVSWNSLRLNWPEWKYLSAFVFSVEVFIYVWRKCFPVQQSHGDSDTCYRP